MVNNNQTPASYLSKQMIVKKINSEVNPRPKFIYIAVFFALLSSFRIPVLPELQLLAIVLYTFKRQKIDINVIFLVTTVLCTHHYAIPDIIFREDGASYPSIYTKAYGSIKLLDLLIIFLFTASLPAFYNRNILRFFYIPGFPTILLVSAFFGLIFLNSQTFSKENFLFLSRSYLLLFVMFIQTIHLSKKDFIQLAKLIIFSWGIKMFFAILIPQEHPLYRSILGINGTIFFAGDEYMTLPYFFVILLYLSHSNKQVKSLYKAIWIIFVMTLIAQRKGSIPIFLGLLFLIYSYSNKKWLGSLFLKTYYTCFSLLLFLFLYNIDHIIQNPLIQLAFYEYSELSRVAVDSISNIYHSNILEFIFGISPFGKYEIINLPTELDHLTSFGKEVGEKFRYQLWSFPLSRCILNVGILGCLTVYIYYIKALRLPLPLFYLTIICIPICYYENLTPVNAFAIGIVYAFMYNVHKNWRMLPHSLTQ